MKKIFMLSGIIFVSLFVITGCGKSTDIVNNDNTNSDVIENSKTETKEEKIKKPTADGDEKTVESLNFFIPTGYTENSYNGMMGVYDYYTGSVTLSELNVGVVVTWNGNYKDSSVLDYIKNKSNTAKSIHLSDVTTEKINGIDWYVFSNENNYYYAAEFDENLYEVTVEKRNDPQNLFETTNEMVKKTLFFLETEE